MKQYKLSQQQIVQIRDAYIRFKDPKLDMVKKESLPALFKALGQNLTSKELATSLKEMSIKNGCFNLIDFLCLMSRRFSDGCSRDSLMKAFRGIDKQKNGMITVYQLKNMLTTMGDKLTDQEFDQIIKSTTSSEGMIDYAGLVDALLSQS